MKRVTNKYLVIVCLFLGLLFLNSQIFAVDIDFDKKKNLTLDELIAGAKKEGKLVWYSSMPLPATQNILKKFNEVYPFIKVDFVRGGGLVVGQRFYTEKSRKVEKVDVITAGAMEVYPDWQKKGYLARLDNLPEWNNVNELAKGQDSYYVGFNYATNVLTWNRKVYKDEELPSDLWEFTKTKWKNKTASGDPTTAGFALNWFSFISDARPKDPRCKVKPTGLGFKWMEAMYKNGHLLAGQMGNTTDTLVSGRRPILVQHKDHEIWYANKHGTDLGWKYPIQGTVAQFSFAGVNSNAPHPYAARLFTNWLLTKEAQMISVNDFGYNPTRKDMKLSDFIKGRKPLSECWIMGIEQITSDETRDFIRKLNDAVRGK